jgi:type II secretory ATPase GspE/PulE/Tfp pilus assembly ATPase PilB-like protein
VLNKLYDPRKKIITIEDPVEYELNGINQIPVNPKRGLTFAAGLRSILRQDPDIIFVGEIRDGETADIAIRSALTGHLIFSTIHTNDAVSSIGRLVDMGVEPYLVASVLEGVLAQRLGRKICTDCKKQVPLSPDLSHRLTSEERQFFTDGMWIGEGCDKCSNSGFRGRVGFFELVTIDPKIRSAISENRTASDLTSLLSESHITMRQDALSKASKGVTTIGEVLRATQDVDSDF